MWLRWPCWGLRPAHKENRHVGTGLASRPLNSGNLFSVMRLPHTQPPSTGVNPIKGFFPHFLVTPHKPRLFDTRQFVKYMTAYFYSCGQLIERQKALCPNQIRAHPSLRDRDRWSREANRRDISWFQKIEKSKIHDNSFWPMQSHYKRWNNTFVYCNLSSLAPCNWRGPVTWCPERVICHDFQDPNFKNTWRVAFVNEIALKGRAILFSIINRVIHLFLTNNKRSSRAADNC